MRRIAAVVAASTIAVAGCGHTSGSTDATDAATTPRTSTAADPCATAGPGCRQVAVVDVDGDGAPDRVGVAVTVEPPEPQIAYGDATVHVFIASGANVSSIDVHSPGVLPGIDDNDPKPYVGAYRISRTQGADLALHTQLGGGSSEQFVVIGWNGGRPALVPRPPQLSANYPDPAIWYIGSSHGVHEWITCGGGAAVTLIRQSAPSSEGIPLPGGGIRESNHFTFVNGEWSPNGSENKADNDFSYNFDPNTETFACDDQAR
jgi:hypothetical protein